MRIGAVFPTCEIGTDPIAIRDWAQAAESLGYSHIICYDHVLGAEHADRTPPLLGPYDENDPFHEPFVLFGYLAGVTTHVEMMTGVLILPQRQTALVAKQAAELAILSGGRFRLGVGTGWNHVEYDALGYAFADRGAMLDEQVELLRALWQERLVDFEGRFHRVERAGLLPRPPSAIPIWFGGMTPPAVRRAARLGDGFVFGSATGGQKKLCTMLTGLLDEDGRRDGFEIDVVLGFGEGPENWRSEIETWRGLGATATSVRTMSTGTKLLGESDPGFTTPQQHIDALETFMREIGAAGAGRTVSGDGKGDV